MTTMMRVRLKADGRIVEILPDGSERALPSRLDPTVAQAATVVVPVVVPVVAPVATPVGGAGVSANGAPPDAVYARGVRARTKLTQAEFAARIGVPIETVRNWEQGKRSPRGPARALLKVIDKAPDVAFAVLHTAKPQGC
jgi:putative transcriptional regulator